MTGLAEVLEGSLPARQAVLKTRLDGLSLLPRGRLDPADVWEYERLLVETSLLSAALDEASDGFDVMLMDTPPGVGHVTMAALSHSRFALVPVQAESLSLRSVSQILRLMESVREKRNPGLQLLGILPTMLEKEKPASFSVLGEIWHGLDGVLETVIPRADVFGEASRKGLPVAFLGGTVTVEARRFDQLAAEVELLMERDSAPEASSEARAERRLL